MVETKKSNAGGIGAFIIGLIVSVGLIIFAIGGSSHIPVGSVGIVKHMNGTVTQIPQGWHWVGWSVSVQKYPTYTQSLILSNDKNEGSNGDQQWQVGTADQQELPVNTSLTWKISMKDADALYQSVGGKDITYISDKIVEPTLKNITNEITHDYGWNDIKGSQQTAITEKINQALKDTLLKDGIQVESFGFTYVGSPAGMAQSQQSLAAAELATKQAQQAQDKAKIENETKIMNAEADAKANQIQTQSLSPEILQQQEIAKWDGKLPTVQGGNAPVMQMPIGK